MIIPQSRPTLGEEEYRAVDAVLRSRQLAMGPAVSDFEESFKKFLNIPYAFAVNSGTSALHLALLAIGTKPGSEVIIPSYACTALLNAVKYTGAHPVIADVTTDNLCLSVDDTGRKITSRTAAIIAVHTFGMAADIAGLSSFGIPVIEDCAHSMGGHIKDKKMGTVGSASMFSFYPTKMVATGEGGMLATSSNKIAGILDDLRTYDGKPQYRIRYNYKMSDISAALGTAQLSKLENFVKRRRLIAERYDSFFKEHKEAAVIKRDYKSDSFYRYVLLMNDKIATTNFVNDMCKIGICCDFPVSKPLHQYLKLSDEKFPGTTEIFDRAVSIPLYPSLTDEEIEGVLSGCGNFLKKPVNV